MDCAVLDVRLLRAESTLTARVQRIFFENNYWQGKREFKKIFRREGEKIKTFTAEKQRFAFARHTARGAQFTEKKPEERKRSTPKW